MNWLQALLDAIIKSLKPTPIPLPPATDWEQELLALHNQARAAAGLAPLVLDSKLSQSAQKHTQWMWQHNVLTHDENGVPFTQRLNDVGYSWWAAGENIAQGYRTPTAVFTGWMNSPGHRANIMSGRFQQVGFGNGGVWWVADYASPRGSESLAGGIVGPFTEM